MLMLAAVAAPGHAIRSWAPIVSPDDRIYPALVLATEGLTDAPRARHVLGATDGLLGVRVRASVPGERVRVTVSAPGWFDEAAFEAVLADPAIDYEVYPTLAWRRARLLATRGAERAEVSFRVEPAVGGAKAATRDVRVQPVTEAPYFVRGADGGADLSWIFAAYVDEHDPVVDAILADARATGVVDRFDGYGSGDPERVYRQVYAIWLALQQRGIRYARVTPASAPGDRVRSQRVRFVAQSVADARSNCVDGSVLIASVLRRIGIEPTLVLVPQHMFLAFDLAPGGEGRAYLETTLLGRAGGVDDERSFASFEAAVEAGFDAYYAARGKLADPEAGAYLMVPIARARALGVEPIGSP